MVSVKMEAKKIYNQLIINSNIMKKINLPNSDVKITPLAFIIKALVASLKKLISKFVLYSYY